MNLLPTLLFLSVAAAGPKAPSVFVSVLVRNKAHTLPYFLSTLEQLAYPKDRIVLHIRSDQNEDSSLAILRAWVARVTEEHRYHRIIADFVECQGAACSRQPTVAWTEERFAYIIQLRQQALDLARSSLADFFLSVDADVFLTNPASLEQLVEAGQERLVVAPLLPSTGLYSNFWAGMTETFYYLRTEEYRQILDRKKVGVHEVPMVHSCLLVNLGLEEADRLAYRPDKVADYPGPEDDMIVFALSARLSGLPLHVDNTHHYGVILLPLEEGQGLEADLPNLVNTLLEATVKGPVIKVHPSFAPGLPPLPPKSKLGFDKVFMINLARRPDRHERMKFNFDQLGIDYEWAEAVDGKTIDKGFLAREGIEMLPEWSEPFHGRPLTYGEIGCFLSHHRLWQRMVREGLDTVLILEDDIKFEPFFVSKLEHLRQELEERQKRSQAWDLVYIGRKILHDSEEPWVEGSDQLVRVDYTYWTLAYILTLRGAEALLAARPLGRMLPVDEFLPIMFGRHPNDTWSSQFQQESKLAALSVHPLLIFPTHYTGEQGYFSDTEDTSTITATGPGVAAESKGTGGPVGPPCGPGLGCTRDEL